jgi:uncharacterized membrane protein SpoIIM required for sporulation
MLVLLAATGRRDGGSPLADSPIAHLIWALLIAALGALLLAERVRYAGAYERGINRGPFKLGKVAIFRLVAGTGVCLLAAGVFIAVVSLRRLAGL